jgi:hypothetical protein
LIVKSDSTQIELTEGSDVQFDIFKISEESDPSDGLAFFGDKGSIISEKDKNHVDKLFENESGNYLELFTFIQNKVDELPEKDGAKFKFDEETAGEYFKESNQVSYEGNGTDPIIVKTPSTVTQEMIDNGTVKIQDTLDNYELKNADFVLRSSMYFDGNLKISVPNIKQELISGEKVVFIYATGDITFEGTDGNVSESDMSDEYTVIFMSRYGNVSFEPAKSTFTSIVFAPEGDVNIKGNEINFNGCFAGKNVFSAAMGSSFTGPSEGNIKDIAEAFSSTEGFKNVMSAINKLPEAFKENTKVGVITYSDYADVNVHNIWNEWKFYDVDSERTQLQDYINTLSANENTLNSNLGDGLRRALGVFESDKKDSSDDTEKFIVVFTGMDPNAYTRHGIGFETKTDKEVKTFDIFNEKDTLPGGKTRPNGGNDYAEEIVSMINAYNESNDANIHNVLIDLSLFRQESNLNADGTPREIIPQLTKLANNFGIDINEGIPKAKSPDGNHAYFMPTKEEVEDSTTDNFIIQKIVEYTNNFNNRLAVEDLSIESARFNLKLPQILKPIEMNIEGINGNLLVDPIDYSSETVTDGLYTVGYDIDSKNISDFAKLKTTDEGETYTLEAGKITIDLYVNNSDGSFKGDENLVEESKLIVEKSISSDGPTITYTFKDATGKSYTYDLEFSNIEFNVVFNIDIN